MDLRFQRIQDSTEFGNGRSRMQLREQLERTVQVSQSLVVQPHDPVSVPGQALPRMDPFRRSSRRPQQESARHLRQEHHEQRCERLIQDARDAGIRRELMQERHEQTGLRVDTDGPSVMARLHGRTQPERRLSRSRSPVTALANGPRLLTRAERIERLRICRERLREQSRAIDVSNLAETIATLPDPAESIPSPWQQRNQQRRGLDNFPSHAPQYFHGTRSGFSHLGESNPFLQRIFASGMCRSVGRNRADGDHSDADVSDSDISEFWTEADTGRVEELPADSSSDSESEEASAVADDILQALGPIGLNPAYIDERTAVMVCDPSTGGDRECRICLETLQAGDRLRILPCLHRYHSSCVEQWLSRNRQCPLCKLNV